MHARSVWNLPKPRQSQLQSFTTAGFERSSRILPHPIEDSVHPQPTSDLQHPLRDVLALVQDNVVHPIRLRDRRLLGGARCADDGPAAGLDELCEEEPDAARDGVHEYSVACLDVVRLRRDGDGGRTCSDGTAESIDSGVSDTILRTEGRRRTCGERRNRGTVRNLVRNREDFAPVGCKVFGESARAHAHGQLQRRSVGSESFSPVRAKQGARQAAHLLTLPCCRQRIRELCIPHRRARPCQWGG